MSPYEKDYAWDPFQTTTEDGYILTAFKVFKRGKSGKNGYGHYYGNDKTESVIFQHGYGLDSTVVVGSL